MLASENSSTPKVVHGASSTGVLRNLTNGAASGAAATPISKQQQQPEPAVTPAPHTPSHNGRNLFSLAPGAAPGAGAGAGGRHDEQLDLSALTGGGERDETVSNLTNGFGSALNDLSFTALYPSSAAELDSVGDLTETTATMNLRFGAGAGGAGGAGAGAAGKRRQSSLKPAASRKSAIDRRRVSFAQHAYVNTYDKNPLEWRTPSPVAAPPSRPVAAASNTNPPADLNSSILAFQRGTLPSAAQSTSNGTLRSSLDRGRMLVAEVQMDFAAEAERVANTNTTNNQDLLLDAQTMDSFMADDDNDATTNVSVLMRRISACGLTISNTDVSNSSETDDSTLPSTKAALSSTPSESTQTGLSILPKNIPALDFSMEQEDLPEPAAAAAAAADEMASRRMSIRDNEAMDLTECVGEILSAEVNVAPAAAGSELELEPTASVPAVAAEGELEITSPLPASSRRKSIRDACAMDETECVGGLVAVAPEPEMPALEEPELEAPEPASARRKSIRDMCAMDETECVGGILQNAGPTVEPAWSPATISPAKRPAEDDANIHVPQSELLENNANYPVEMCDLNDTFDEDTFNNRFANLRRKSVVGRPSISGAVLQRSKKARMDESEDEGDEAESETTHLAAEAAAIANAPTLESDFKLQDVSMVDDLSAIEPECAQPAPLSMQDLDITNTVTNSIAPGIMLPIQLSSSSYGAEAIRRPVLAQAEVGKALQTQPSAAAAAAAAVQPSSAQPQLVADTRSPSPAPGDVSQLNDQPSFMSEGPSMLDQSELDASFASPAEQLSLAQFLIMAQVRFLDQISYRRRTTIALPTNIPAAGTATGAATAPLLDFGRVDDSIRHSISFSIDKAYLVEGCQTYEEITQELRRVIGSMEYDMSKSNPPLFETLSILTQAQDMAEIQLLRRNLAATKAYHSSISHFRWYEWRAKMEDGILRDMNEELPLVREDLNQIRKTSSRVSALIEAAKKSKEQMAARVASLKATAVNPSEQQNLTAMLQLGNSNVARFREEAAAVEASKAQATKLNEQLNQVTPKHVQLAKERYTSIVRLVSFSVSELTKQEVVLEFLDKQLELRLRLDANGKPVEARLVPTALACAQVKTLNDACDWAGLLGKTVKQGKAASQIVSLVALFVGRLRALLAELKKIGVYHTVTIRSMDASSEFVNVVFEFFSLKKHAKFNVALGLCPTANPIANTQPNAVVSVAFGSISEQQVLAAVGRCQQGRDYLTRVCASVESLLH
ncbi:hypothetical protein CAOG_01754 [Capsaspora owczarzaki ATCC 30864]|uniref:Spc7 kinetochore protein domain-containing protein n=1 Tax=Capsaspora owczarzaki (strain ATCC 30864) TaxID=595528 RepID=A0A0D2WL06_CAPO3|nr:hypothetical protein CAOG_01754 [Capsaspora owczarzaki ATCC 30864]KJE90443.1 hypothetical protein CAOG_001754 [Capsaspora owczarzaki ATCC 30864]|eukprot:XP_004364622.1 hypothetical protein CAOG_01754 [Capsaspora owczarzaki ATCC 30864]